MKNDEFNIEKHIAELHIKILNILSEFANKISNNESAPMYRAISSVSFHLVNIILSPIEKENQLIAFKNYIELLCNFINEEKNLNIAIEINLKETE